MADLSPIVGKLAKYVRLLASDRDGEVVAAVRALQRELKSHGADIDDLAERIEVPPELNEEEMKEIYDAALAEVERKLTAAHANGAPSAISLGMPSVQVMVMFCHEHVERLPRSKDREFISNIFQRRIWRFATTPKQQTWIEDLYFKLGGTT